MNEALLGMLFKAFPPEMIVQKLIDKFGPQLQQTTEFVMKLEEFSNNLVGALNRIEHQNNEILTLLRGDMKNAQVINERIDEPGVIRIGCQGNRETGEHARRNGALTNGA